MNLMQATKKRDEAREKLQSLKEGSRAWLEAEEDLNFWQSKVAHLEALKEGVETCGKGNVEAIFFDKDGNEIETKSLEVAIPFELFNENIKVKSLRIKFYENGRFINAMTFYRSQFRVEL